MPVALIIGGTGQVGVAVANRLSVEGWIVVLSTRVPASGAQISKFLSSDSIVLATAEEVAWKSFDLVLSCIAFDAGDSQELLRRQSFTGRIIVISSASVYCDSKGRTLDEASENGFPEFGGLISERCDTVEAGSETYSTKKIAMEQVLLQDSRIPVNVLRPCAIHGPLSKHAREWWFVKRLLDGRKRIPVAYNGESRFQTTSVSAIAEAVVLAAKDQLPTIANVSDADSPSVREIGIAIMDLLGIEADLIGLSNSGLGSNCGISPWSVPKPFIIASSIANAKTYSETVESAIHWLKDSVGRENWKIKLPELASYPVDHFDYMAEDEALSRIPG